MYETKVCTTCKIERPKAVFCKDRSKCKYCHNAAKRAKYKLETRSEPSFTSIEEINSAITVNETQTAAYNIRARINQYPPRVRPLMLKQAEMYALGEYTPTTIHSTGMK